MPFWLLVVLFVMLSWAVNVQASGRTPEDWQDRYIKGESSALSLASSWVNRFGPILRLKLKDSVLDLEDVLACEHAEEVCRLRNVRIRCDADVSMCRSYTFMRREPAAAAFIVLVRFYEGSTILWIDEKTGQIADINSEPHFSPDGTHFAIVQTSDAYDYTGIQVWRTEGPVLLAEYRNLDTDTLIYLNFVRWLDNDSFLIATHWYVTDWQLEDYNSRQVSGMTSMVRRGANWFPERPPARYTIPIICSPDYPNEEKALGSFLPLRLPDGQVCIEDWARSHVESAVRNCIFSAVAMPCETKDIPQTR
jgi:hypothetical protein